MPKRTSERGRILRASDVGYYHFCHRAWWLKSVKGYELQNRAALDAGIAHHATHGATVARGRQLRRLAVMLLGMAVVVLLLALLLAKV